MALQTSGPISLNNVNVELGKSGSTNISMNNADVRDLAGIASGTISMNDFYGASAAQEYTLVAGNVLGSFVGYNNAPGLNTMGTLNPNLATDLGEGIYITRFLTNATGDTLNIDLDSTPNGQGGAVYASDTFTSVSITGSFSGGTNPRTMIYLSSNAAVSNETRGTVWSWSGLQLADEMVSGNTYTFTFAT